MSGDRIEALSIDNSQLSFYDPKPRGEDVALSICDHEGRAIVRIHWNGKVAYDPADLDEATRIWWDAVGAAFPGRSAG